MHPLRLGPLRVLLLHPLNFLGGVAVDDLRIRPARADELPGGEAADGALMLNR